MPIGGALKLKGAVLPSKDKYVMRSCLCRYVIPSGMFCLLS